MKKVYICGKVSGLSRAETVQKFAATAAMLQASGYEVINPLELVPEDTDWPTAMRACIAALTTADHLYCLPDWTDSQGATLEHIVGESIGIRPHYAEFFPHTRGIGKEFRVVLYD